MWIFETWVYQNVINTEWFMWGIVGTVFGYIFLSPILIFICLLEKDIKINVSKIMQQLKNKSNNESSGSS